MFHREFPSRPHLLIYPRPTQEEVDLANADHNALKVFARVADSLNAAIRARPAEVSQISEEFATLLTAILVRSPIAQQTDKFNLYTILRVLPRVTLELTYNHFLADEFDRSAIELETPT